MAVNIDPSEVRSGTPPRQPAATPRLRLPARAVLVGSLGGAGLLAFSVGAFSFFSTLADPRARTPRPMQAATAMPDLKDGMPALVEGGAAIAAAPKLNLPRPIAAEPAAPPATQAAVSPAAAEPVASDPNVPALRTSPPPPPIQNAATLPETRTVTPVAPPARTAATIAPARTETVKAKPVLAAISQREPAPEPAATAAQPNRKATATAAKPAVQKTAARKTATGRTVAEAEPAAESAPAASPEESDIPGARQFRAGVKAIGGFFGGDTKDD